MELLFVSPTLAELDTLESEVLACALWEDVRPAQGVAGLCDWRLGGRISRLLRTGELAGRMGEVMIVPGRPRLSFDKIVLFGAGPRDAFDEGRYREVLDHMLATIDGLGTRVAVVQLPGRQGDVIPAERAADMLLEAVAHEAARRSDVWTLVEPAEARRRIQQHMVEERRRIRYEP